MSLYDKNGITITVSPDGRNYMVEGDFPISYHATLDKAVLKVAKHTADKGGYDLHTWLGDYETVARVVADAIVGNASDHPSHLTSEATHDPSKENKCPVDSTMDEEAYSTRGDR
jgi:hypothetical protein